VQRRGYLVRRFCAGHSLCSCTRAIRVVDDGWPGPLPYLDSRGARLWYTGRSGIGPAEIRRQWYSPIDVEWSVAPGMFDLLPARILFNPPPRIEMHRIDYGAYLFSRSCVALSSRFYAAHIDAVAEQNDPTATFNLFQLVEGARHGLVKQLAEARFCS